METNLKKPTKSPVNITLTLITLLLLGITPTTSVNPEKVVIAINCGGDAYEGSDGVAYEADDFYSTGTPSDYGLQYDIELTKDEELYQTERWADKDLVYTLPFEQNDGSFVLVLKFSEVYFSQANEKVFDIALGSKIVVKNLDIFDQVGKAKAHDEYVEFELRDGLVYYKGNPVPDAFDRNHKTLTLQFLKGSKDNPKINAILIMRGNIMETEYADKQKKLEDLNKKRIQQLKMKSLIIKKHDVDEEFDEAFELSTEEDVIIPKAESTVVGTLFSKPGAYICVSFLIFLALYFAVENFEESRHRHNHHHHKNKPKHE